MLGLAGEAEGGLVGGEQQAEAEGFDGEGGEDEDQAQGGAVQEQERGEREDPSREQEYAADRPQNKPPKNVLPFEKKSSELTTGLL